MKVKDIIEVIDKNSMIILHSGEDKTVYMSPSLIPTDTLNLEVQKDSVEMGYLSAPVCTIFLK